MTLPPSLYLDCLNTPEWALRRTRSMSTLYFADIEPPLTGAILTNWSKLLAHGRSALHIRAQGLVHVEQAGCRAADAYSQESKRDLRRQALECTKLPNMFGSAANRYPPPKVHDSQTMPSKHCFLTGKALVPTVARCSW
jgi:hypothetical protein